MLRLADDVSGLRVLDAGCGEGRFCRMLGERGASVTGIDPTPLLIAAAHERHPGGEYALATSERLPYAHNSFDLVVNYVSLVETADYVAQSPRQPVASTGRSFPHRKPRVRQRLAGAGLGARRAGEPSAPAHRQLRRGTPALSVLGWDQHPELAPPALVLHDGASRGRPAAASLRRAGARGRLLRNDPQFEDWYRVPLFYVMLWQKPTRRSRCGSYAYDALSCLANNGL